MSTTPPPALSDHGLSAALEDFTALLGAREPPTRARRSDHDPPALGRGGPGRRAGDPR